MNQRRKWLPKTGAFLACLRAYVGQPHGNIGWATSMPFTSINPTNPRTNQWIFWKKILRIGGDGKWPFFESAILNFFFQKTNFKMADWKKAYFPKSPILKIFSRKFLRFVLGLVGLNDEVQKMHFLAVFELLSDSLTAIYVELHQCPSHHSILLTQGRIWEIFAKKFWELR